MEVPVTRSIPTLQYGGFLFVIGTCEALPPSSHAGLSVRGLFLIDTGANPMWIDTDVASHLALCVVGDVPVLSSTSSEYRSLLSVRLAIETSTVPYRLPDRHALPCAGLSSGFAANPQMTNMSLLVIGAIGMDEIRHFNLYVLEGIGTLVVP